VKSVHSPDPIHFSQPPTGVYIAGTRPKPSFTEEDLENAKREAYRRGSEDATKAMERQLLEQRSEVLHLQTQTFAALAAHHAQLSEQMQGLIPELAIEAVQRILAATVFDREMVLRIAHDMLSEVAPGKEQVEVRLAAADLELIAGYEGEFREKHPEISFCADSELRTGDCVVRSRFGTLDGRLSTKVRAVEGFLK
jgi:flagellar assembly protein FliH